MTTRESLLWYGVGNIFLLIGVAIHIYQSDRRLARIERVLRMGRKDLEL